MYRNWPKICEIGKTHRSLMTLLAIVNPGDEIEMRIIKAYPECFSDKVVQGPIPLSVLRQKSAAIYRQSHSVDEYPRARDNRLLTYNVLTPHNIPYLIFDPTGINMKRASYSHLPADIDINAEIGTVVEHIGTKWVVVKNTWGDEEFVIAPLECIDPTV